MKRLVLFLLFAVILSTAVYAEILSENHMNSQNILGKNAGTEATQLEQIKTSLQKGPILLKIGAEWCEPCKEMKPILNQLATEYKGKATIISIDVDQSPKLADYFGVNSIPDSFVIVGIKNGEYVYMQEDGSVTTDKFKGRIQGLMNKEVYEKDLNFALKKEKY
jgi:thioredoxin-like negative regulator of GroEL